MEFYECLADILNNMSRLIVALSKSSMGEQDLFNKTAKAALVKSYEFTSTLSTHTDENTFLMVSSLRSICEDYIVLRYIFNEYNQDKDQVIDLMMHADIYTSSVVQWNFFEKYHPNQILYYEADFPKKEVEVKSELRNIVNSQGKKSGKQSLPTVRFMANKSGLSELYDYIYHATSIFVHFNPHTLLRMGWGRLPEITFSTRHFNVYYRHFACFYGAYLFKELCAWMISIALLDKAVETDLQKIADLLEKETRWPEIITFEEMNIGGLSKLLFYKSPNSSQQDVNDH